MRKLVASALFCWLTCVPAFGQAFSGFAGGSGGGGGGGSGTVTSIATGCQATGGTITTTGTISTKLAVNNTYTSNQTLAAGDACNITLLNAATAQTLTLNNWSTNNYGRVINKGAGPWTITAGTGAINSGCAVLVQNQAADIQFDGTNWNIDCGYGGTLGSYYAGSVSRWYQPNTGLAMAASGGSAVANTAYCAAGTVTVQVTIKALGSRVATLSAGNASWAVYYMSAGTFEFLDGTPVGASGASTGSTGNITGALGNTTDILYPGVTYLFCEVNSATPQFTAWTGGNNPGQAVFLGSTTLALIVDNGQINGYTFSQTQTAAWAATVALSGLTEQNNATAIQPIIAFEVN